MMLGLGRKGEVSVSTRYDTDTGMGYGSDTAIFKRIGEAFI